MNPLGLTIDGTLLGETVLSEVDGTTGLLSYRGYSLHELIANRVSWEDVLFLLWYGNLPTNEQRAPIQAELAAHRFLTDDELAMLHALPRTLHGMDALRTAVSALAASTPPTLMTIDKIEAEGVWLTAKLPTLLAAYIRIRNDQSPISPNPSLSQAANFLAMLHGTPPDTVAVHALDTYMVILAENGLNISTFVASVVASTRNDLLSAITAAIATLKGQAHGGANELALRTFQAIGNPDNAKSYLDEMLARKERLMGVGHRVFDVEDPRKRHMYEQSRALAQRPNANPTLHLIAERVAEIISTHPYYQQRQLYPNVEFYSAPLLAQLGFPADCLTAVFACARMPGWIAHIREQLTNRQLVRPEAAYCGERGRTLT